MIPSLLFGCGVLLTFLVALAVVGDLIGPLRTQLHGPQPAPMFAIAEQMKWGFVRLVLSILLLGWILSRFIPRKSVGTVLPRTEVPNADVWQPENE